MDRLAAGRLLRILRIRRGWRLADLAARSGLSCTALHRHETGSISSFARLDVHARALELRFDLRPLGRGSDMVRTLDEEHAAIVNALASALQAGGHRVEVETSYSEWGERGRIDLLASVENALVVGEIKSELADLQDLLGAMNAKARLAPTVARKLGWPETRVVWLLAVAATSRNRSVVAAHPALFRAFRQRWFRGSIPFLADDRLLLWVPARHAGRRRWLAGRRRVRL